jgi:glycosyltransferase involved in cell wall biosynthesis
VRVGHVHRIGGIGGSERHLLSLLPALAARGLEVSFVGLDDTRAAPEPFYAELDAAGIPFERVPCRHDLSLRAPVRLARGLRGSDLVHTHLVHADVYGALAGRGRLVSTKHNPDPFRTGPYRYGERLVARRASRVIAISESLRRFTVEQVGLPEEKIEVVRYGLDELPVPWGENPALELDASARVLLCVARLVPQKGVDVAARALPLIRAAHPDAVLVVLGEGPQRPELSGEGVFLPGRVGDVAAWYRRADVVVHPVRWEGFGLALLEAMLAGKPVVASAVSSTPEIVADGETGLLVPPDDPERLAEAVSSLLADPVRAQALGRAGLERARAEFSVARMADETIAVYRRALGG